MIDVPIGCAERMAFIEKTSLELIEQFHAGNKLFVLTKLEELPPRVAFAVLASAQIGATTDMARYLREMA